jgi:hypothetical protein
MLKKGVDHEVAKVASEAGGWIITGFEALQLNTLVKAVPGLSKVLRVGVKDVVQETVQKFTAKSIASGAVEGFVKFEGQEVPTEVMQELTGAIAENTGKYLTNSLKGTGLPLDDINAYVERLKQTAIQSAISFAPMGIGAHGSRAIINMTKTEGAQNWIDKNGQNVIDKITAKNTLNSLNSWLQRSKDPNDTAFTGNDFERWRAKQMGIVDGVKMTPSAGTLTPEQIRSWDAQIGQKEEIKTKRYY